MCHHSRFDEGELVHAYPGPARLSPPSGALIVARALDQVQSGHAGELPGVLRPKWRVFTAALALFGMAQENLPPWRGGSRAKDGAGAMASGP